VHDRELSATRILAAAGVPVLVAVAVYLPALSNGFVWDDPLVLRQLRAIQSPGDLLVLPPIIPRFYFRPVIFVTYLFDRALGGETPFWFHASVITWHALNTLLVFALARRLFPADALIASGGALLFAVFPTHVESVAWMAGRSDVVVGTFVLLTVLLFLERERAGSPWLGGVVLLLAMLSKEMALACVALVPVLDLLSTRRLQWARYLPLVLVTGLYFALRQQALGTWVGGIPSVAPAAQLALDLLRALGFYTVRAVVPVGLSAYMPEVPGAPGYLLAGLAVLPLALALTGAAWRHGSWPVGFLVAWFLLTLAPSLGVIVRRSASAVVADRYLYVPSVASCILLAWAVVRLAGVRRMQPQWSVVVIGIVSLGFAMRVVPYTRVWADNLAFWSDVAAKTPQHALPHRELATALMEHGRLAEAEQALERALDAKSDREGQVMAYSNLGNLLRRLKRYDEAQRAFKAGLRIGPHPALYHNLGMALMAQIEEANARGDQTAVERDILKARDAFEQALRLGNAPGAAQTYLEWDGAKTHALLGQVLFSLGDRAGARQHLEESLRLQPTGPAAVATRRYLQKMQ
jgi:Flp pilus assembly protein TadD